MRRNSPRWENDFIYLAYPTFTAKEVGDFLNRSASFVSKRLDFIINGFKKIDLPNNSFLHDIKRSAKARNIDFNLSLTEIQELFKQQDAKCAISGIPLEIYLRSGNSRATHTTASLDRKDSSKSYNIENVQWIHKSINMAKGSLSDDEFIQLCKMVVNANSA